MYGGRPSTSLVLGRLRALGLRGDVPGQWHTMTSWGELECQPSSAWLLCPSPGRGCPAATTGSSQAMPAAPQPLSTLQPPKTDRFCARPFAQQHRHDGLSPAALLPAAARKPVLSVPMSGCPSAERNRPLLPWARVLPLYSLPMIAEGGWPPCLSLQRDTSHLRCLFPGSRAICCLPSCPVDFLPPARHGGSMQTRHRIPAP